MWGPEVPRNERERNYTQGRKQASQTSGRAAELSSLQADAEETRFQDADDLAKELQLDPERNHK